MTAAVVLVGVLAGLPSALLLAVTVLAAARLLRRRRVDVRARRRRLSMAERTAVLERDGWACVQCGSHEDLEIDHVIPFARGGASSILNAQVLCLRCNRRKSSK